jgi:hypothetical protein
MVSDFISAPFIILFFFKGTYFHEWMECFITAANIQHQPKDYPRVIICNNSTMYPFLLPELNIFLLKKNITNIHLLHHHIALRSYLKKELPALSTSSNESGEKKLILINLNVFYLL